MGCRTDEPSVEPAAAVAPEHDDAPSDDESSDDEELAALASPSSSDGIVVTLASQCRYTWKGTLVQGEANKADGRPTSSGWEPGGFEIRPKSNRELLMRPGDSLLLTNPSGGIMALRFDNLTAGYGARVEVTPECSGVNQTVVRAAR